MAALTMSDISAELSAREIEELEAAEKLPPVFDPDSPEMTEEMLREFKRVRREEHNKQAVSLRLSPATLKKARKYGKGYTAFLSRLLDEAINDEAMVRRCI